MFKFLGIQRVDFVPDGQKDPMQGYSVHFSDDTVNEGLIGSVAFKVFLNDDNASEMLGIRRPSEISMCAQHIDKPCDISFNRKGRMQGISFSYSGAVSAPPTAVVDDDEPFFKPDNTPDKPKKL